MPHFNLQSEKLSETSAGATQQNDVIDVDMKIEVIEGAVFL